MKTDVFRFMVHRPPAATPFAEADLIGSTSEAPTPFIDRMTRDRADSDAVTRMRASARAFVAGDGHVGGLADLDVRLAPLLGLELRSRRFLEAVRALAGEVEPAELRTWKRRVVDSLVAALVLREERRDEVAALELALRVLGVLEHARAGRIESVADVDISVRRTVVLPRGVFPLPAPDRHAEHAERDHRERLERLANERRRQESLAARMVENQAAIRALRNLYERDLRALSIRQGEAPPVTPGPSSPPGSPGMLERFLRPVATSAILNPQPNTPYATIAGELGGDLSASVTAVISRMGRDPRALNVPDVVGALEKENQSLVNTLYTGGVTGRASLVAGGIVRPEAHAGDRVVADDFDLHVPGVCPVEEAEDPRIGEGTVPEGVGRFESLGVSDLLVVKQTLVRYEKGEVAHIENVMSGEARSRTHRALFRTEVFSALETETSEESERDLETTERFELQAEAATTIEEEASRYAGVTLTGSYGPSVEFSANAGFSSNTARSKSNATAATHARDIVERSVHRIQERVRRERSTLAVNEVEVVNEHGFTNRSDGAEHITGVYRWVDKLYQAQVYDYGKRELIEFVVPEPAALLTHFSTAMPPEGLSLARPEEPGYCVGHRHRFEPLEPKHINAASYLFWAARYNARNVRPPPPEFQVVGLAISNDADEDKSFSQAENSLKVPTGYQARKGVYTGTFTIRRGETDAALVVVVGRHFMTSGTIRALNKETDVVPVAVVYANVVSYGGTVEVECQITDEAMNEWRLETYGAILEAYAEQKAAYDAELQRVRAFSVDVTIEGSNPAGNRAVEQREIKRAAISQMTGQHFDDFDAMRRNVPPHGYPQPDLGEAAREGAYIRFVEQAFEWENMQYLLYPYFWARKDRWPRLNQLTDRDPLFETFLRAGSCRINVPVRPGFENAVNTFLSTGCLPWNAPEDGASVTDEELFLAITEELKGQQGAITIKSGGTVSVASGAVAVVGKGTDFTDDDVRREITIGADVHSVASVEDAEHLTLATPRDGPDLTDADYVIGAKAVGVPWTVRVPTSLVILQKSETLPVFPETGEQPTPA